MKSKRMRTFVGLRVLEFMRLQAGLRGYYAIVPETNGLGLKRDFAALPTYPSPIYRLNY